MSESLAQIRYDLTLDDAVAYSKYHYHNGPGFKRRRRTVFGILMLWMFGASLLFNGIAHLGAALLTTFAYGVVLLALIYGLRWAIGDRLIRKQFNFSFR